MKQNLPTRRMRPHPNLAQLKRQARQLLRDIQAGIPSAIAEVHAAYSNPDLTNFALHDAQLVLARSYGFASWPKLKAYVDGVTVRRLADAILADDLSRVQSMLRTRPELANMALSYGDEHHPIHFAVMQRSIPIVRLLMQHGANARAGIHPHRDATTAWILAKEREYHDIVAIIEQEEQGRQQPGTPASPQIQLTLGDEVARTAAASGDLDWLRTQHAKGTLTNPIGWRDGGLLTVAVHEIRPDVLRLLLDLGVDPNERTSIGEGDWLAYSAGYPLWNASALGREQMADLLLQRGADPNVHVDPSGSSVYSAFSHKQWPMVELLRRHGGIVSADIAAIYRQTDLVRQMLQDEANGHLPPGTITSGKPLSEELLQHGTGSGATEIVRMALQHIHWHKDDPRWFRPLTEPLYFWHHIPWLYAGNREFDRSSYFQCFQLVLNRCDPNLVASFGRTALHEVAAMRDHITDEEVAPFAQALLQAGARTDLRDDILHSTPLGWACRWGRASVVQALLAHGADSVELATEPWARPTAWAKKMGHTAILKLLQTHIDNQI